jgi:hypothetical protein
MSPALAPLHPYSTLTTVLRIMVSQPYQSRLLPPLQRRAFRRGELPQPGQVTSPGVGLRELVFESLTFQTA